MSRSIIIYCLMVKNILLEAIEGDILIVSITADEFVRPNRPYFNTDLRLETLASITLIDYVTI